MASIYGYQELDDAIAMANDSDLGLIHSVWTRDRSSGVHVASRLEAGTVGVNDGYPALKKGQSYSSKTVPAVRHM